MFLNTPKILNKNINIKRTILSFLSNDKIVFILDRKRGNILFIFFLSEATSNHIVVQELLYFQCLKQAFSILKKGEV